jgi:hypothetical protein
MGLTGGDGTNLVDWSLQSIKTLLKTSWNGQSFTGRQSTSRWTSSVKSTFGNHHYIFLQYYLSNSGKQQREVAHFVEHKPLLHIFWVLHLSWHKSIRTCHDKTLEQDCWSLCRHPTSCQITQELREQMFNENEQKMIRINKTYLACVCLNIISLTP